MTASTKGGVMPDPNDDETITITVIRANGDIEHVQGDVDNPQHMAAIDALIAERKDAEDGDRNH